MCDLKDVKNDKWFHTSDASEPKLLKTQQVTKNGFIVLYKRKAEWSVTKAITKLNIFFPRQIEYDKDIESRS